MGTLMDDILINSTHGTVKITFPHGSSEGGFIYIGNWYQGQIVKEMIGWRVYLNERSELSVEDSEVIRERVSESVNYK